MPPTYSSLVRILAVMMGSWMRSMVVGSGQREGFSTSMDVVFVAAGAAAGEGDAVADAGGGGDEVEVDLALEALLDDFHVKEAEEAAAEAEAEGGGGFGFEGEAGVVELEFSQRLAQCAVLVGFDGVEAGEDHGLDVFKAGEGFGGGVGGVGDGIADLGVGHILDCCDEEADFARGEGGDFDGFGGEDAPWIRRRRCGCCS